MSRRENQRKDALIKISRHVLENGLMQTSLRQLAGAADVSDRMLLYYFKNKAEIMSSVLAHLTLELTQKFDAALKDGKRYPVDELFAKDAALCCSPDMRPYMRLGIEINVAAGRGEMPYVNIAKDIVAGFIAWIEARLDTQDEDLRKKQAGMILVMIDGLAMVDVCIDDQQYTDIVAIMTETLSSMKR